LVDPNPLDLPPTSEELWAIIRPLLESAHVFDQAEYKAGFKFFLDEKLMDQVTNLRWVAPNQARIVYTLPWTKENLRQLLNERLRLSSRSVVSLGQISEVGDLDDLVLDHAASSPRQLMAICNRLFTAHLSAGYDGTQKVITEREVNLVIQELRQPPVQVDVSNVLDGSIHLETTTLQQIIWQGETEFVEFKSTLRYNLNSGNRDAKLEQVVAQELCGFANTSGGIVIIGVGDTGEAKGLEYDFKTLGQHKTEDSFRLMVTDIITQYLDRPLEGLKILFENYANKRVCVIMVAKSRQPSYCLIEGRAEFYVRVSNSVRRLDVRQAVDYIHDNFNS